MADGGLAVRVTFFVKARNVSRIPSLWASEVREAFVSA